MKNIKSAFLIPVIVLSIFACILLIGGTFLSYTIGNQLYVDVLQIVLLVAVALIILLYINGVCNKISNEILQISDNINNVKASINEYDYFYELNQNIVAYNNSCYGALVKIQRALEELEALGKYKTKLGIKDDIFGISHKDINKSFESISIKLTTVVQNLKNTSEQRTSLSNDLWSDINKATEHVVLNIANSKDQIKDYVLLFNEATKGNFTPNLSNKDGSNRELNTLINTFFASMDTFVKELGKSAESSFSISVMGTYQGELGILKEKINKAITNNNSVVNKLKSDLQYIQNQEKKRSQQLLPQVPQKTKRTDLQIKPTSQTLNSFVDKDFTGASFGKY